MNHFRILQRAFDITRFYRVLWIFGILLALTTSNPSSPNGGGGNNRQFDNGSMPNFNWPRDLPRITPPHIDTGVVGGVIGIIIAVICVLIVLAVIFAIVRYVSHTAVIRMGNNYEATGEKIGFRAGWRLGWSRAAFRAWLVNLLLGLAGLLFVVLTLLVVAAPQLLWLTRDNTAGTIAVVMSVGLFFLALLLWIIVFAAVSMWKELSFRAIAIEGLGVFEGLSRGWGLFRRHLGDVIIMGLILFGIGLIIGILGIIAFFVLGLAGVVVAGLPALLAGGIANIFAHGATPWIIAAIVGAPILLLVIIIPLLFFEGLYLVFKYNVWTLTFRELLAMEATQPQPPAPADPALEPELSA